MNLLLLLPCVLPLDAGVSVSPPGSSTYHSVPSDNAHQQQHGTEESPGPRTTTDEEGGSLQLPVTPGSAAGEASEVGLTRQDFVSCRTVFPAAIVQQVTAFLHRLALAGLLLWHGYWL
jgi:hypothetical protein